MTTYSIIVPSYNQEAFIGQTLDNLTKLKAEAANKGIKVQIIVVDNCSDAPTHNLIKSFETTIDHLVIEKDKGQYDAINKGLNLVTGNYWTWLNTDDLIDIAGFLKIADYLCQHPDTDYIYGDVTYIDEHGNVQKQMSSGKLSFEKLIFTDASICQPGSFFRKSFTDEIGNMSSFHFAFDYEYILRCFKNNARVVKLDTSVSFFRYYTTSKSGSQDYRFLQEQLTINKLYGGKFFTRLSLMLRVRILKRKLLN